MAPPRTAPLRTASPRPELGPGLGTLAALGINSGRWTHYISFLAQMPSPEVIPRLNRNNVKIVLRHDSGMTLGKSEMRKTWPRGRLEEEREK